MTVCSNISPKKRKICIGDLKTLIKIQVRTITPEEFDNPDYSEVFTEVIELFASVKTSRGHSSFNDIGTTVTGAVRNFSHEVIVRYSESYEITSENWLEINNIKYNIVGVENLEERNEWLILYCLKKGDKTKPANLT